MLRMRWRCGQAKAANHVHALALRPGHGWHPARRQALLLCHSAATAVSLAPWGETDALLSAGAVAPLAEVR